MSATIDGVWVVSVGELREMLSRFDATEKITTSGGFINKVSRRENHRGNTNTLVIDLVKEDKDTDED